MGSVSIDGQLKQPLVSCALSVGSIDYARWGLGGMAVSELQYGQSTAVRATTKGMAAHDDVRCGFRFFYPPRSTTSSHSCRSY